jgi:hypothetical protein
LIPGKSTHRHGKPGKYCTNRSEEHEWGSESEATRASTPSILDGHRRSLKKKEGLVSQLENER